MMVFLELRYGNTPVYVSLIHGVFRNQLARNNIVMVRQLSFPKSNVPNNT